MKMNSFGRGLVVFLLASIYTTAHAAVINWTNTAGGNWNVAANWSPNQLPGSSDTAVITNDGTYTVTMDVSPTIGGLAVGATNGVNTQTLLVNGQTLTLNGQVTVNSHGVFDFNNGALGGAAVLSGALNWSGGTVNYNSSLTVATSGVLNLTGNNYLYGPLTNNGTVDWQRGAVTIYYGYGIHR